MPLSFLPLPKSYQKAIFKTYLSSYSKWFSVTALNLQAPNNKNGRSTDNPTDQSRPGEHCVAYEALTKSINDLACSRLLESICQGVKGKCYFIGWFISLTNPTIFYPYVVNLKVAL